MKTAKIKRRWSLPSDTVRSPSQSDWLGLSCRYASLLQMLRMEVQMLFDKGGDKVVAVVIASVTPKLQRVGFGLGDVLQRLWLELIVEKGIRQTLIDQDLWIPSDRIES